MATIITKLKVEPQFQVCERLSCERMRLSANTGLQHLVHQVKVPFTNLYFIFSYLYTQ